MPRVSVLLPVRDAGRWLVPSLASLWRQTFRDFEVIALDDGSTDGSGERLERIAATEPRLRVIRRPAAGLPQALNAALGHARAPLIARHDADDLSHRERFARQIRFLEARPRRAAVGCRVRLFPSWSVTLGMRRWVQWHNALVTHEAMARDILIDSPLAHGTLMIRRRWLERVGGWRERGWPEDVDLWLRLLERGARFGKCEETLYAWRQHASSATHRDPRYGAERFGALRLDALRRGFLARVDAPALLGVGRSLAQWASRMRNLGLRPHVIEAGRPDPRVLHDLLHDPRSRAVLVFSAVPARARWRTALVASGKKEMRDFVFVA